MVIKHEDDEEFLYLNRKRCTNDAPIVSKMAES